MFSSVFSPVELEKNASDDSNVPFSAQSGINDIEEKDKLKVTRHRGVYTIYQVILILENCGRLYSLSKAGLASRRKSTQVFDLPSTCVSFGHPLEWTCDDFLWLWSSSNSYASRRKFFTVWPPNVQVDGRMQDNCIYVKFTSVCDLHELASRLANPFGRPYASSGFANLRWLTSTCESVWPGLNGHVAFKLGHFAPFYNFYRAYC